MAALWMLATMASAAHAAPEAAPSAAAPAEQAEPTKRAEPATLAPTWTFRGKGIDATAGLHANERVVVFADVRGQVHALDASTGKPKWTAKSPRRPTPDAPLHLTLQSDVVVVSWPGVNGLQGLEAATGAVRWRRALSANVTGLEACGADHAVVVSHRASQPGDTDLVPVVHAVAPATGETLWMEAANGPLVQGLTGWVFTQDRRLGSDYSMAAHRCQTGEATKLEVNPGTVWRVFEVAAERAIVEVAFNRNTVFDVCALPLSAPAPDPAATSEAPEGGAEAAGPSADAADRTDVAAKPVDATAKPTEEKAGAAADAPADGRQCQDLSRLAPSHYRLRGARYAPDAIDLILAPPAPGPDLEGRFVRWRWHRPQRLAELPDGAANGDLLARGPLFASSYASAGRKAHAAIRVFTAESPQLLAEGPADGSPALLVHGGPGFVVLTTADRVQAFAWPQLPGVDLPDHPEVRAVKPRASRFRVIGE